MAGIGFELKKLYKHKSFVFNFRAVIYASLVAVGPQILCLGMISSIQLLMLVLNVPFVEKNLFLASIVYCFIFSQLITSGFSMVITRYVADKLYSKEYEKILSSLYGIVTICVLIGGVIGIVFLYNSPIDFFIKLSTYILYMELIIMWLLSVYLSNLKDYIKIVGSYLFGIITIILLASILLNIASIRQSLALLISLDVGMLIIIIFLMFYIKNYLKEYDNKYFEFLTYFDKFSSLFFVCFFYTLSIYVHNFIFWGSNLQRVIENTYWCAPIYDVPTFYALLTILPASVIFVVSVETKFYDRYKEYFSLITNGGNLLDIQDAKKNMLLVLWREIFHLMALQLFFSLIFIIIANYLLPFIGITQQSINIFNILVLGAFCNISMFLIALINLYFENRKGALLITTIFLLTNIPFTLISLWLGENYYGLGYLLSSFISLCISIFSSFKFLNKIDYITFCSQPVIYKEKKGLFTLIVNKLYKLPKES